MQDPTANPRTSRPRNRACDLGFRKTAGMIWIGRMIIAATARQYARVGVKGFHADPLAAQFNSNRPGWTVPRTAVAAATAGDTKRAVPPRAPCRALQLWLGRRGAALPDAS